MNAPFAGFLSRRFRQLKAKARSAPPFRKKPLFESLEARVLLSADISAAAIQLADGIQDVGQQIQEFIDTNAALNFPLPIVARPADAIGGEPATTTVAATLKDLLSFDVQQDDNPALTSFETALDALDADDDGTVGMDEWLGFAFLDKIEDKLRTASTTSGAAFASEVATFVDGLDAGLSGAGFTLAIDGTGTATADELVFNVVLDLDFTTDLPLDLGTEMEEFGISFPDLSIDIDLALTLDITFGVFIQDDVTVQDFFVEDAELRAEASAATSLTGAGIDIGFLGASVVALPAGDHISLTASVEIDAVDPSSATKLGFTAAQFDATLQASIVATNLANPLATGRTEFYLQAGRGDTILVQLASPTADVQAALTAAGFVDAGEDTILATHSLADLGKLRLSIAADDSGELGFTGPDTFSAGNVLTATNAVALDAGGETVEFLLSVGGALPMFVRATGSSLATIVADLNAAANTRGLSGSGVVASTDGAGTRLVLIGPAGQSLEIVQTITIDSKISTVDLATPAALIGTPVIDSDLDVDIPVAVKAGIDLPDVGLPRISLPDFDPFSLISAPDFDLGLDGLGNLKFPLDLQFNANFLDNLLDFNNISVSSFIGLLGQLSEWLVNLSDIDFLDIEIPLTGISVGEIIDFVDTLRDSLLYDDADDGVDGDDKLITDLNRALDNAGLGGKIYARPVDGKIQLVGDAQFEVSAGASSLGFTVATLADRQSDVDSTKHSLLATSAAAATASSTFTIQFRGTTYTVTVDGTGNAALGNDTQKLLDAGNTPTFGNAQELAEDFAFLLELNPSVIDARYENQELLFDLRLSDVFAPESFPLDFELADLGLDLGPLLDISTESELAFAADGSLSLTLGVSLRPSGLSELLSPTTPLISLNDGDGVDIKEELAITAPLAPTQIVGRLSEDASFKLRVGAEGPVTINLSAASTATNTTIAHLVADLQAAINATTLNGDVTVGNSGNRITLTSAAAVTLFEIIADTSNPAVTQLGLQPQKVEQAVAGQVSVAGGKDVPKLVGRLSDNATFNVQIGSGTPVAVTVLAADTASNVTILDLVDDLNAALAGQLAGGNVTSFVLTDDATFTVTLDSDNDDLDGPVTVTVHAADARILGFVQNQEGRGTLVASYAAPASGVLAADMTFLLAVGNAEPVEFTIDKDDTAGFSRDDFVAHVNGLLAGDPDTTGVTFEYDAGADRYQFTAGSSTALKILSAGTTQGNANLAALATDVNNALQNALQDALGQHFPDDDGLAPPLLEARASGSSIVFTTVNPVQDFDNDGDIDDQDVNPNAITTFQVVAAIGDPAADVLKIPTTTASATNLVGDFAVSAAGDKLVITADNSITAFTIDPTNANAETGLGLGTANLTGNEYDLVIEVQDNSVGQNGRFFVSLDGALTIGQVISRIEAQTSGEVDAGISADGTKLVLRDASVTSSFNGDFHVEAINGSAAALKLGLLRADTSNPSQAADGVIEGGTLAGLTLADRFFIENAVASGSFSVTTPGGINADANFGFVGVGLSGGGSLFGAAEIGLKAAEDSVAGGRITLKDMAEAVENGEVEDLFATPVVTGGGDLDLAVSASVAGIDFGEGAGVDAPSLSIQLDSIGNPFAAVFGTNPVANGVIPSGTASFDLVVGGETAHVNLAASATTGNATLDALAEDLQAAIAAALAATSIPGNVFRVDATGNRLFITAVGGAPSFQIQNVNATAQSELGLYEGTGNNLPKLDVETEGDFGSLVDFGDIDFGDIINALQALSGFLDQFEAFGFLSQPIPLINVNINEILSFADDFATAVEELENNPAGTLQLLEAKLHEALGISPTDADAVRLSIAEGNILKLELGYDAAFTTSLPINFDLGLDLPFDLAGAGSIQADGRLGISLDFGIDLDGPINANSIVVFDTTGVFGELDIGSDNLAFRAALGPAGIFVSGGEVAVGGTLASAGGSAADEIFRLNLDLGDDDYVPIAQVLGDLETHINAEVGADVHVNLPVFFPTESSERGAVTFDAALSFDEDGGFEITGGDLGAVDVDGLDVALTDLFDFDFANASLLDNILLAIDGIDMFLAGLQDVLDGEVFGVSIPLIGDKLSSAADFIADFREDFIGTFREEIERLTSPGENVISRELFELLGPAGLGILLDYNGDDIVNVEDVALTTNIDEEGLPFSENFIQWNVRIGGPIANANAGIGFDLGIPGLGLETEGAIDMQIDWELQFGFGLSGEDAFYIDISDDSELQVDIEVTLPDAALTGRLAFLQLRGEDAGTRLGLGFAIDIHNRSDESDERLALQELGSIGLGILVAAQAEVHLDLTLGLNADLFPSIAASFPEIVAEFELVWRLGDSEFDFDESDGRDHLGYFEDWSTLGNAIMDGLERVAFENVGLDLGSFLTEVLSPIVQEVQKATKPIQPIIEILTTPIPVISDLAGPTTLLDLAAAFSKGRFDVGLIKAVADIITLVNSIPIPEEGEDLIITFGDFVILGEGSSAGPLDLTNPNTASGLKNLTTPTGADFDRALASKPASASKSFTQKLKAGGFGDGFSFPILTDPAQVFGLLMGDEATLIEYDMPALEFKFSYTQFFPIFGPLGVSITGSVGATIDFAFGYDTAGIKQFIDTDMKNPLLLFNGFFVSDLDDSGRDVPELQLDAGISAAAELNLGVARAGVAGGIFAEIDFDLHDPNDDGKLRIYELVTNVLNQAKYGDDLAFLAPLAIFDVSGEVFAKLFAFLKIDLFFFSLDKEFNITPPITLVDFEVPFTRVPTLATEIDGGILQLNIGEFAGERLEGNITDGNEQIFVKQGSSSNKFLVWSDALGVSEGDAQEYTASSRIVANGGEGNDTIDLSGVTADIDFLIEGGVGNDIIKLGVTSVGAGAVRGGTGDDQIWGGAGADIIHGEQGNDTVHAGGGADILFGDAGEVLGQSMRVTFGAKDGNDTLHGEAGNDFLFGGGGNDTITGGLDHDIILGDGGQVFLDTTPVTDVWVVDESNKAAKGGADNLSGGVGDDWIYAGKGNDTVNGDGGNDELFGEDGADTVNGGGDNDQILGGIGDDVINAGEGHDEAWGEDGIDRIRGDGGNDILHGGRGADSLWGDGGNDELYGDSDGDRLSGGTGDDRLVGGFGNDVVDGNEGDDLVISLGGSEVINGGSGDDVYMFTTRGARTGDLTTIYDSGAIDDGVDTLRIDGTGEDDLFLLRAMSTPAGAGFVAKLNRDGNVERFNYKGIESLEVNGFSGDDRFYSDDTRAIAALNGGIGNDFFQIGQMFKSDRSVFDDTDGDGRADVSGIAADDLFNAVETTRGWLSNGITFPMTINGGVGNDEFVIFRNLAVLTLNGGEGDDLFTVRAFALAGSQEDTRARTDLKGDAGADTILYAVNAPVGIDGGDGFDTIQVIGTEFSDDFVITDNGVFGGGLNVTYANIERLKVDGAEGDDRYFVLSTDANVVTEIAGGLGSDTFFVGGTPSGEPIPVVSNDLKGHSGVILNSVETVSGGSYEGTKVDGVSANVADNDEPFIVVTPTGGISTVTENALSGGEGWEYDRYHLVLTRRPDEDVVVSIVSPSVAPEDRAQGSRSLEFWNGSTWVSNLQLTFTDVNWNLAQEVRFRAVGDAADEGTRFAVINHMVASHATGETYNALPALSVKVQINDDDRAGVIVTPSGTNNLVVETAESGAHEYRQDTFEVVLSREPTGNVRVWMDATMDQVVLSGADVGFEDGRWFVDFTDADYSTAKQITLTAKVDAIREGFHSDFIDFEVASLDQDTHAAAVDTIDYDETTGEQEPIPDSDPKGFVLLRHQPDTDLPITLTIGGDVQAADRFQVVGNTLVFLNEEGDPENRFGNIVVSYQYVVPGYDQASVRPVVVDVYDDEAPSVIVLESGGSTDVAEGGATDTYKIVLSRAPAEGETVRVNVQPVKTRSTGGDAPAYFEFQVQVSGADVQDAGGAPYVLFDSTNWNVAKEITVTAIDDTRIDGDDTQVFAPGLQTVNKIRGPLFVEGAAGEGSISLPEPQLLPGELNFRPADGAITAFSAGTQFDELVIDNDELPAGDLVGKTIEIVGDPGHDTQSDAVDRFWRIEAVIDNEDGTSTLQLKNPSQRPLEWGDPQTGDLFAITDLADTFFVSEEDQIDFMMVFDNDSVANDTGAMFLADVDLTGDGELLRGRLTGLGMGPDVLIGGAPRPGGITFGDMEVVRVDLGKGDDTLDVTYATIRPTDDKRPDFHTQTIIDTGDGNDTVTVGLQEGHDGAFALDTGNGDDVVDARASTLPLVLFGGGGNDNIAGGSGDDIIFGDRGRVDYVNAEGEVVTRLGHTIVAIPTSFATGATASSLLDIDGYDANRDGVDETPLPTDDDGLKGLVVTITSGAGQGQSRIITGNTATEIFVSDAWQTLPDSTSTYRISFLPEDQTDGISRGPRLILSTDVGIGGNDYIDGRAGRNTLIGGSNGSGVARPMAEGAHPVFAGDEIHGGDQSDIVFGDNARLDLVPVEGADGATMNELLRTIEIGIGGGDRLVGAAGDDLMLGGAGGDAVFGDADADTILGDNGRVYWSDGDLSFVETTDTEAATTGADELGGGEHGDVLLGGGNGSGEGADVIHGDAGSDILLGDNGRLDYLQDGDLLLDLVQTADFSFGAGDTLHGDAGTDLILGGAGDDEIHGDEGQDLAIGDNGQLEFQGAYVTRAIVTAKLEGGDDVIEGNAGNDIIIAGTGNDTASGDTARGNTSAAGDGNDFIFGDHGEALFHVLLGSADAVDYTRSENATVLSIFTGSGEGAGNDILFGNGRDDAIVGQQGADIIFGGDDDDDIWGGHNVSGGFDTGDTIDAGTGFDVVAGDNAHITRRADTLSTLFRQLVGSTLFYGYDGVGGNPDGGAAVTGNMQATPHMGAGDFTRNITILDHEDGTSADLYGADAIAGGAGDDLIFGQLGNDTIQGDGSATVDMVSRTAELDAPDEDAGDGDDYIEGNGGADWIYGNLGQDDILGGSSDLFGLVLVTQRPDGDDTLFGGAGTDAERYYDESEHARDADVILGDNGRIFKVVGAGGAYLAFNYDTYAGERIIPRAYDLLDYTPGNAGSPTLRFGHDLIFGESGDDVIHGMAGEDILFGNAGDDDLYGGNGDDWMSGGNGVDGMLGDDGHLFTSRNGMTEPLYGLGAANAQTVISTPGNFLSETIYVSGQLLKSVDLEPWDQGGDDVMYGGLGGDFMHGGEGIDGMSGAEAMEPFYGNAAARNQTRIDDVLHFNAATSKFAEFDNTRPLDKIGDFFLNFEASIGTAKVNDGDDKLFGDLGHDWLVGGTNKDHLYGGMGDDVLNADDNLETNTTDAGQFADADIAFGGAGRDQLIANNGADRLIDWSGEFNAYWVPFSPYGQGTVSRNVSPHLPEFLYALAKADGADQTLGTDRTRNGEPFGELGLVLQQDALWGAQHGGPNDPQAGNGKSRKDAR